MTDEPKKKPSPPARRGGLGRGLGALIPSAPLGNASGKGHFWSALDNPPAVDDDVKKRIVDDIVSRADSGNRFDETHESPGQRASEEVSRETLAGSAVGSRPDPAVDITVDNWPATQAEDAGTSEHEELAHAVSDTGDVESHVPTATANDDQGNADPAQENEAGTADEPTLEAEATRDAETSVASSIPSEETAKASNVADRHDRVDARGEIDSTAATAPLGSGVSRETPSERIEEDPHSVEQSLAVLIELSPDEIRANPKNPRQVFDDDELAELSESIKEFGLLQPIVVRETADGYELVMGERRLRASRLAAMDAIPVIVRQTDDDDMLRDALLENIHRVQLHPLEEAAAYQQLIDEFGVTHEELAQRIKRSRPVISNTIRLLKLPTRVQNRVAAGVISGSHARALLGLDDHDAQEALATRIVAEGLSVRATEEAVAMHVGDGTPARRAGRRKRPTAPALTALADRLSDHFDTRALVQLGRTKGKIVVEFASVDDLERIIGMMAPPLATVKDVAAALDEQPAADSPEVPTGDDQN